MICLPPGKGNTSQETRVDGKMMAEMNNCQHIGSNIMKWLQHIIFVQEPFSYCDRITDKTLPILIPMENVRSVAACGNPYRPMYIPAQACDIIRCKNLALNIRDCLYLCLSEETLKAVGPFYLVSMPGEVKDPTSLHWKCVTCGLHILT